LCIPTISQRSRVRVARAACGSLQLLKKVGTATYLTLPDNPCCEIAAEWREWASDQRPLLAAAAFSTTVLGVA